MLRLKSLVLALGLASAFAAVAAAQPASPSAVPIVAGSRVRVKAASLVAPLVANCLEQRGDTLVFIEEGTGRGLWSFAIRQIERLETTAGEGGKNRQYVGRGALYGGGAGVAAALLFASSVSPSDSNRKYNRVLTAAVGAAVGAGIGAVIGSRIKTERWHNVPLPRQLSLVPSWRGLRVTVGF